MARLIPCACCGEYNARPYAVTYRPQTPHVSRAICRSCGLIYANPQATEEELEEFYRNYYDRGNFQRWKELAKNWARDFDEGTVPPDAEELYNVANRIFRSARATTNGRRWLEVGAGLGQLSRLARSAGFEVTATDLDEDAVKFMLQAMGLSGALQGDLARLSLQPGSFDVVVANHVLEHVGDLNGSLRTIHGLLDNTGILFVGVPNLGSVGYKLYRASAFLRGRIPEIVDGVEHTYGFTPRTLSRCLEQTGFKVQSIRALSVGRLRLSQVRDAMAERGLRRVGAVAAEHIFKVKMECLATKALAI